MTFLDAKIPDGPIESKWDDTPLRDAARQPRQQAQVLRHRRRDGGLGRRLCPRRQWASWATRVKAFTFHDSARRAHSIAAQGGINAAKNYHGDGDSIYRLFYDTVKGGDFRSREANVYRLAQVSNNIIDQCVAQGVPFAREYGGLLDNRSFGGAQVSRTFYARGQTGQQLLLGAYQALAAQVKQRTVGAAHEDRAARHRHRRRSGRRHRDPRPAHRRDPLPRGRRRRARDGRVLQRVLPVHQRDGVQHVSHLARSTARVRCSPTRPSRRSTRRPSPPATSSSRS